VTKYTAFRTVQRRFQPARKSHSKEPSKEDPRSYWKDSSADFGWPRALLRVLMDIVKPWMEIMIAGRPCVFQQDGALIHMSHLIQNWLSDNVDMFWSKEFWPPNSPDLNPLEYYYVWSVVERVTNKSRYPNDVIKDCYWGSIRHGQRYITACELFRPRIKAVIQANGEYIE